MNETGKNRGTYIGYDYKELVVENSQISIYLDGYENFGWIVDEHQPEIRNGSQSGKTVIKLKRDRKIMNKAELTRLERHFEDNMRQLRALEKAKTSTAMVMSLTVAMIGTAFMAGSTFAVTHEPPMIILCIILAIPGFAGWILPYFIYKRIEKKKTEELIPLIDEKQDELYELCEKGNKLLV